MCEYVPGMSLRSPRSGFIRQFRTFKVSLYLGKKEPRKSADSMIRDLHIISRLFRDNQLGFAHFGRAYTFILILVYP